MLIIENISGVSIDINDLGLTLEANETVDLTIEGDARDVAASGAVGGDLNSLIASNNIRVKDPIDGTTNLSALEGIAAIRTHNEPHYRMPTGGRIADAIDVDLSGSGTYLRYDGSMFERRTPAQLADEIESEIDITNLSGYDASGLIDWTADQGSTNILFANLPAIPHASLTGIVADEHIDHSTITISAGAGMVGGGDLTASRAFSVGEGIGITVNTNNISVNPAEVNHDNLLGYVDNEHIDWTTDKSPLQIVSANMENSHAPHIIENSTSSGLVSVDSIGFIKVIATGSTAAEWLSNQLNIYTSISMSADAPLIMSGGSSSYLNLSEFNPTPQVRFGRGASIGIGAWSDNNLYLNANGKRITSITDVLFDIKTDDIKFSEYPNTRDDGSTSKALYVDADGKLQYGDIAGAGVSVGGVSKVLDTWTLLSGTLYYNDFVHNLGTTNVSMHLRETSNDRLVYPEYTEIVDANTIRTVVEGNTEDLTINVVSGSGPAGADGLLSVEDDTSPTLGGTLTMNGYTILTGTNQISPTELGYLDSVTSNIQTQLNSKTTATGHTHVYRLPHTWGISGPLAVAAGDTNYILPMFISLASGQTASIVACRHRINSGTSATISVRKNGTNVTGFTGLSVTTTSTTTDPANVSVTSNDMISIVVTGVSGAPQNLSFTLFVEYSQ